MSRDDIKIPIKWNEDAENHEVSQFEMHFGFVKDAINRGDKEAALDSLKRLDEIYHWRRRHYMKLFNKLKGLQEPLILLKRIYEDTD